MKKTAYFAMGLMSLVAISSFVGTTSADDTMMSMTSTTTTQVNSCRSTLNQLRVDRKDNLAVRKANWATYRTTNKETAKVVFATGSRDAVRAIHRDMRDQISKADRNFVFRVFINNVVLNTGAITSYDTVLANIQTIANTSWDQAKQYVTPGQEAEYDSLRSQFLSTLTTNKTSHFTLVLSQATVLHNLKVNGCKSVGTSTALSLQDTAVSSTEDVVGITQ